MNRKVVCGLLGTGRCCHDRHLDIKAVLPDEVGPLCKAYTMQNSSLTDNKAEVTCKFCLELIHS